MVTLRRLSLIGIVTLLLAALPLKAAEVDKFLPDKTQAVLTINIKQCLHGGLVKKYGLEPLQQAMKDCGEVHAILETMGINPFQDIDRVVVAAAGDDGQSHSVAIVHGRFDTAQFQDGAKALALCKNDVVKVHKRGDHRFYEVVAPGKHGSILLGAGASSDSAESPLDLPGSFFFGLVDKGTVVLTSDKESMLDAYDRAAGSKKPALKKSVRHAIQESDSKQSIWFVANVRALTAKDVAAGEEAQEPEEPTRIAHVTGGITLDDEIKVHVSLTAVSVDAAKDVMQDLDDLRARADGFAALLAGTQKECACLKDIPKAFKATRKGKTIAVEGQLDVDLLEQVIGLLQKAE